MRYSAASALAGILAVSSLSCVHPHGALLWSDSKTFPSAPEKVVRVDAGSLDVRVKVVPDGEISVTTRLEVDSSSRRAAKRWIENGKPQLTDSATALEVKVSRGHRIGVFGFFHSEGVIELKVPAGCRLEVETASGDVDLDGKQALSGVVQVRTRSGDVTVHGGASELSVSTSSGEVRVEHGELASIEADTSSGDVRITVPCAKAALETSSGDLDLSGLTGSLSAKTSSGEVRAEWSSLGAGGKIEVRTVSGDVALRLPKDVKLSGGARSRSGQVRSDLDGRSLDDEREVVFETTEPAVDLRVESTSGEIELQG
jgi:DUF4097 and DUF4098 domain-containing protein YvlB